MKTAVFIILCVAAPASLAAQEGASGRPLTVAVAPSAPMASRSADGRWTGPAIDLMREAADATGHPIRFVPAPAAGADAAVDAAFPAPATVRAPLHSAPLYTDTLALAGTANSTRLFRVARTMLTVEFLWVVLGLSALLLLVGAIVWWVERDKADLDDQENPWRGSDGRTGGVAHGFWWAGVTMTTIGYGDLVPKTMIGRTVAMVWMLVSMAITASLTAFIVSSSDTPGGSTGLASAVAGQRVGVVVGSPAVDSVRLVSDRVTPFRTLDDAMAAEDDGQVDLVAASAGAFTSADVSATETTTVQLPLRVAARADARDFILALDRATVAPSWWDQAHGAMD